MNSGPSAATEQHCLPAIIDPGRHPGASSADVQARMSRLRRRDNGPEMAVRRRLHSAGLRYRVAHPIPGQRRRTIDIAFPGRRLAVYIDGCFWHSCPEHMHLPKANSEWWVQKMAMNRARDAASTAQLETLGWTVLRFWEHEPPDQVVAAITTALRGRRDASSALLGESVRALFVSGGGLRHARTRVPHHPADALAGPRSRGGQPSAGAIV